MNIKLEDKLFSLGIFENNEYFHKYLKLIEDNCLTKRIKSKTERHHIIPRSYFNHRHMKVENDGNVVNLLYKDHILAHYYLSLCINDRVELYSNLTALAMMLNESVGTKLLDGKWIENLDHLQELYEKRSEINSELTRIRMTGHKCSDETKSKIGKKNKENYSNTVFVNKDGECNMRVKKNELDMYLSQGYTRGRNDAKCFNKISDTIKKKYRDGSFKGNLGKSQSEYQKKRVSEALKGVSKSDIAKSNMSKSKTNKILVSNNSSRESFYIEKSELSYYLNKGFVRGRLKK